MSALAPAHAADPPVKATTQEAFEAVATDVRREMDDGGRYAYVRPDERARVERDLARMHALFEKYGSVERMTGGDRIALFNTQEKVNSTLALRDRDRLVCERGTLTGSRIVSTSCHTYGDIEAARQASQKLMQEKAAIPCTSKACGGQ
jgi:hypothetical protein